MNTLRIDDAPAYTDIEWAPFAGGELEAPRPKALCPTCRDRQAAGAAPAGKQALCFQCYRAELEKNRKLKAAAELDTASEERFQTSLPFEPVNTARLTQLKAERQAARTKAHEGAGSYIERRRKAQIEARHALTRIFQGLKARRLVDAPLGNASQGNAPDAVVVAATRAAELQLPEAWLPFVVSR